MIRGGKPNGTSAHRETKRHMDGGKHPLQDDHTQHDPRSLSLFEKDVTTGPTKSSVDSWQKKRGLNIYSDETG